MTKKETSLADLLYSYGGYELRGTVPLRLRVTEEAARRFVALDGRDTNPYAPQPTVRRKTPWKMPSEADLMAVRGPDVLKEFIQHAARSRVFYMETLCAAVVYGMGVPRDDCMIREVEGLRHMGSDTHSTVFIHAKPGASFERFRRRWKDHPIPPETRIECGAGEVVNEWNKLKAMGVTDVTDHHLLVTAFVSALGVLPVDVELVTVVKQSGGIGWRYRRREDAGSLG